MAESDKQAARKKRRVRNPETFRERALKASESPAKKKTDGRVKRAAKKVASPVVRPVGRGAKKAYSSKAAKPVRPIIRVLSKILFISYIRNSWRELKQVTWPNWTESRRLTYAVLIFAVIFGASIAAVDWGLDKVFRQLLLK